MNAEWKAKWVAALRSGEYEQGRGVLQSHTGRFCCLGVLCDIAKADVDGGWGEDAYDGRRFLVRGGNETAFLPPSVRELTGIRNDFRRTAHLMAMNDNGETFAAIADYIEREL